MAERGPAFCGLYDTSSLLQYCNGAAETLSLQQARVSSPLLLGGPPQRALPCLPDDNLSGTSGMEVDDRVSALEQRLQLQEDELAVLKAALADALRRLRACEEQGAALRARGTPKGRAPPRLGTTASVCQLLKGLPTRTPLNGSGPPRRVGGYATSPSSPKKEATTGRSARRYLSPERLASVRREDPRSRTTSSSSNCSAKKEG
ncbi:echinoderm microtubule-associated protein-like 1 [Physeter macrocephalus]|uniref:Echinoderm microtubule-associated protein-like 1 n=1 Tax=Physeter macrocephalus TaxID=9755 RepID=A0A2Y9TG08_PHYMC|nr:echinoderm microtubule-associated protein-like 1 [Physeter catodon]|eukprot:XP_023988492.2 echinoderm microtubule-associated protein-like 1 [Physeter catodon]